MAASSSSCNTKSRLRSSMFMASRVSAIAMLVILLSGIMSLATKASPMMINRPCDEIYVVGEGETLHTISVKCGDAFILERNPHIYDPDDVFPGLVLNILP
ncbi:unnamed protein product [Coffea canephora]|uniref:Uncharacterized protein n=1 Tax=Coffea canephora TaxID=49390 RepID=A0A068UAG6_COFCA|nr:unnamed protein product [Coffea canephora]